MPNSFTSDRECSNYGCKSGQINMKPSLAYYLKNHITKSYQCDNTDYWSLISAVTYKVSHCRYYLIIENIIKSLKPKNSHGYDEISTSLLKTSSVYISSPLNHICNKSLSGIFPQRLKYAVVKPLFKKVTEVASLTTDQYPY
jgi:hypothetical protein